MRKVNIYNQEELSEKEAEILNEALYYAVRENHNCKTDQSKTGLMRKALDIMKAEKQKPNTSYMCNRSLDDFFTSCVRRGWKDELKEIEWLEVG